MPGDYVRATGCIVPNFHKGILAFRLEVMEIARAQRPLLLEREERANLDWLRGLRKHTRQFSTGMTAHVSVICPKSDDVFDDFMTQLAGVGDRVRIERLSVPISNGTEVTNAIRAAAGNILVLIRGGGSPEDFHVFD